MQRRQAKTNGSARHHWTQWNIEKIAKLHRLLVTCDLIRVDSIEDIRSTGVYHTGELITFQMLA